MPPQKGINEIPDEEGNNHVLAAENARRHASVQCEFELRRSAC